MTAAEQNVVKSFIMEGTRALGVYTTLRKHIEVISWTPGGAGSRAVWCSRRRYMISAAEYMDTVLKKAYRLSYSAPGGYTLEEIKVL